MPRCLNCNTTLETITYGSAIAYQCPRCKVFFDENLSRKALVELIDEAEPEGQEVIRDVSRKCCLAIVQYLKARIDPFLAQKGVIPLVWGTTSRMLYSPLSDVDVVFIIPDKSQDKVKPMINRFDQTIRNQEIRLKNLIDRTTFKKIPPSISSRKVPFSALTLVQSKVKNEITRGMLGKAKPFQPPQMILLSCALPLANEESFADLRSNLLASYHHLADKHDVLLEHLISGLYSYNGLAHIYYGRKEHIEIHSLPPNPPYLNSKLAEAVFEERRVPDFKSLDFREWEQECGNSKAVDNGSKVIYRCVCDFLVSVNLLCSGKCEDLFNYESFDALSEKRGFSLNERNLFFLVQKWRLGVLPSNFNRLWQVAALVAKVLIEKISRYELTEEIKLARELFHDSSPIDYRQ